MSREPGQGCRDYYIVRVYRRDKTNLTGLVETVGHDTRSPFNSPEELWRILRETDREQGKRLLPTAKTKKGGKTA